jgi:nitroreductase
MTMFPKDIDVHKYRKPDYPIDDLLLRRWSPRAMSGELSDEELMTLFEAARWAPSSSNEQPWRFIYAKKGTAYWDVFFDFVSEGNKRWCKTADILVVIISKNRFTKYDADNSTHSFSAGSAFQNLQLQGTIMSLVVHPFGGFDAVKAKNALEIPDDYSVDAMIAIGRQGIIEDLDPKDSSREFPSDRKKLSEIVFEGKFKA